jgi:hypothetical protein
LDVTCSHSRFYSVNWYNIWKALKYTTPCKVTNTSQTNCVLCVALLMSQHATSRHLPSSHPPHTQWQTTMYGLTTACTCCLESTYYKRIRIDSGGYINQTFGRSVGALRQTQPWPAMVGNACNPANQATLRCLVLLDIFFSC